MTEKTLSPEMARFAEIVRAGEREKIHWKLHRAWRASTHLDGEPDHPENAAGLAAAMHLVAKMEG
jgi:hypothetical protein